MNNLMLLNKGNILVTQTYLREERKPKVNIPVFYSRAEEVNDEEFPIEDNETLSFSTDRY